MKLPLLRRWIGRAAALGVASAETIAPVAAQEAVLGAEALARQLANPIASLISVPLQSNWDRNIGPLEDGRRALNVQPVIPVSLSTDWNLINRVILPVVDQSDVFPGAGSQFGLGDTVASLFFSPKNPTAGGWIWGAGPVFLLPTATDDLLGTGGVPGRQGLLAGRTGDAADRRSALLRQPLRQRTEGVGRAADFRPAVSQVTTGFNTRTTSHRPGWELQ